MVNRCERKDVPDTPSTGAVLWHFPTIAENNFEDYDHLCSLTWIDGKLALF